MNSSASSLFPDQISAQQVLAPVVSNHNVAPGHFLLCLHAPSIAHGARAGQFVHVLARDSSGSDPLLRRAFSIMEAQGEQIKILFRAGGRGTLRLSQARGGDELDILGPLGQPFDRSLFHVKQQDGAAPRPILIGGGVGVPPMVFLGKTFKDSGFEPLMLIGARGSDDVLAVSNFHDLDIETQIATEDGSLGQVGRVTNLLETALQTSALSPVERAPRAVIYACGPIPMLRAVAAIAARYEVPCQVSLEENMPCGIGVCNGCVVAMKQEDETSNSLKKGDLGISEYGRYRRICVTGPAVWASEVDWEAI